MPAKKLDSLLNLSDGGNLQKIIQRARKMGSLTDDLLAALPESERVAIVGANIREDGELVVICASPAWASRMRFEADRLLAAAREAGFAAETCRVRVSEGQA